jgi:hypothetical protein
MLLWPRQPGWYIGDTIVRQSEVQSRFLKSFGTLFPQLTFRGMRRLAHGSFGPYAFVLRVALGRGSIPIDMLCAALTEGYPEEVRRFIQRIGRSGDRPEGPDTVPVLIAPFLSPEARALCHAAGVGYFDLAGNAGLDTTNVYLELGGRPNPNAREKQLRDPFAGKAERVARRLLVEPERSWSMRGLAEAAGVSLGMASMATTALAEAKLVTKGRRGLSVTDLRGMLEAWAESYDLRRSAWHIYRSWWGVEELEQRLAQRCAAHGRGALTLWSGAGHLLAEGPSAPRLAFYWQGDLEPLIEIMNLDEVKGRTYVFVFEPYDDSVLWETRRIDDDLEVVHPVQLYLDLGSGDDAELELAQRVRASLLGW